LLFTTDLCREGKPLYKERLMVDGTNDLAASAGLNGYAGLAQ
jgi:hypothetical protein